MKNKLSLLSFLLLTLLAQLFIFSETRFAQLPPPSIQTPKPFARPSIKTPTQKPYVSIDLNYSILLPEPTYSSNWIFQEGKIGITGSNADIAGGKQNFKQFTQTNNDNLLSKIQGRVTDEKYYETDNIYSSVTLFAFDDGNFGVRKFSVSDNRLYVIFAQFTSSADAEFFDNAFKTFKSVGEEEVKAEIQRKFEEATPPELPQEPVLKNQQSDLKEENLKGKVSKIIEESENISPEPDKRNRKLAQTREYNNRGNLTKVVRIDYRGNPDSIEIYGYIDGKRVLKTGYVKYAYNPPPPAALPSKNQPEPKRDLRYSTSYEKKYQDGKLIEKILYSNNGNIWLRQVFNYKDNQLEFLSYTSDGKPNQKYVSTLDKNGLVLEETSFDVITQKPNAERKYKYAYEFDKKGNWVKRIISKEVTENEQTFFKPLYTNYRTITYYE